MASLSPHLATMVPTYRAPLLFSISSSFPPLLKFPASSIASVSLSLPLASNRALYSSIFRALFLGRFRSPNPGSNLPKYSRRPT